MLTQPPSPRASKRRCSNVYGAGCPLDSRDRYRHRPCHWTGNGITPFWPFFGEAVTAESRILVERETRCETTEFSENVKSTSHCLRQANVAPPQSAAGRSHTCGDRSKRKKEPLPPAGDQARGGGRGELVAGSSDTKHHISLIAATRLSGLAAVDKRQ